jgi:hypothetical protein
MKETSLKKTTVFNSDFSFDLNDNVEPQIAPKITTAQSVNKKNVRTEKYDDSKPDGFDDFDDDEFEAMKEKKGFKQNLTQFSLNYNSLKHIFSDLLKIM